MAIQKPTPPIVSGHQVMRSPSALKADQTQALQKCTCLFCGENFTAQGRGRKPSWCSNACKSAAYRCRRDDRPYPPAWKKGPKID